MAIYYFGTEKPKDAPPWAKPIDLIFNPLKINYRISSQENPGRSEAEKQFRERMERAISGF